MIWKKGRQKIWFVNYSETKPIEFPFEGAPFVGVIWNNRKDFVSPNLIEKILKANCKYFVAAGENCEQWHDLADETHICFYPDFDPPDSEFVMTTWHTNESLKEVIWFALNCTNFDGHEFTNYFLVKIDERFSIRHIEKIIDTI